MRDTRGLDRCDDDLCAAAVVDAHLARREVWWKKYVDALRAVEGMLECSAVLDVGDGDVSTCFLPRSRPAGVAQHDTDLLLLAEQCLSDDLARMTRSTQHDEHSEPPYDLRDWTFTISHAGAARWCFYAGI